ncbi:transglycosylase SLT domain-containing protein [Pseudobdellovibrio sp. HCB154]|uniref:transglycosylase SLT domain-containing protein n=1 Tax=Pseudobdellovibrio sp. HCB154 TaxID=3386277 RepID=UPI003916E963
MISTLRKTCLLIPFIFGYSHAQLFGFTKLKEMSCEQLDKSAKDKDFALSSLAGIRGIKKCPGFNFDMKSLSDFERKLYLQEIAEANILILPTTPVSTTTEVAQFENASINELRKQISKEKKPVEKMSLLKQLRQKFRSNNKRNDAIKTLKDWHALSLKTYKKDPKNTRHQELYLEASVQVGRHFYSENEFDRADKLLSATVKALKPQEQNLTEISYLLGKVKEDEGKFTEALAHYESVLEELKKGPSKNPVLTREKMLWTKAWVLYKSEDYNLAAEAFKALATETLDPAEKSRSNFFYARCLARLDKKDQAKEIWLAMTKEDFYSYYSLLAYDALQIKIPPFNALKTTDKFKFDSSLSFLEPKQKDLFNALLKHEEVDLAERAAQALTDKPEQMTVLGLELAERGQRFLPLFIAFAKLPIEQKQDIIVKNSELLFPRLWETEVKEMASTTGLPPSLIFSIMRQESAFNINSRSGANALGLMQVIPPLAKSLARKYKVAYKKPEDLYNPQINIKLGSYELSDQVKKQKDQYALVAAAYNAGPNAVARWLKQRFRPKFDIVDFVEEIPYDETKLYVKIIARNHLFYDRLESPSKETDFPEKFIKATEPMTNAPAFVPAGVGAQK